MASIKSSTRLYGGANISVRKTFMLGIKRPSSRCLSSNIHHPSAVTERLQAWEVGHDVRQREADSSCQWNQQIPYKEWLLFWHSAPVLLHLLEGVMTSLDSISISMRWYHSMPTSFDTVGAFIINMADSGRSRQRGWYNTKHTWEEMCDI